jgi:ribonuclease HII
LNPLIKFDNKYYSKEIKIIAGIDEAGRGPLAGPVVAAAVIFNKNFNIDGVDDSKKLSEKKRNYLSDLIKENAISYSFGIIDHKMIDEINILQATLKAMKEAVNTLFVKADLILIDGNKSFISAIPTKTIVKGDSKSFSIAAASILAKVKRDEIMKKASILYPGYAWAQNKGYGTKQHIEAIKQHGYTEFHRESFLKKILANETQEELL